MAVGLPAKTTYVNGDVFSASDINDTNGTLNLVGQTTNFYAGKNAIINGDYRFNQRSFTSTTTSFTYGFDRFFLQRGAGGTVTYSAQTFTAGTAPVAEYEGINFARLVTTSQSATNDYSVQRQKIENVRTFAGRTVTMSAWIKAGTNGVPFNFSLVQNFGTGGSSEVFYKGANQSATTSWVRYSSTFTLGSMSGKTITSDSALTADIWSSAGSGLNFVSDVGNQNVTLDIWGVQVETGSVATAFQTATGTIQGELAACQRYYYRHIDATSQFLGMGSYYSGSSMFCLFSFPVTMRIAPSLVVSTGTNFYGFERNGGIDDFNSFNISPGTTTRVAGLFNNTEMSGTAGQAGTVFSSNASASVAFNSEL
jgi:hypothetical protein